MKLSRRRFGRVLTSTTLLAASGIGTLAQAATRRRMTIDLVGGAIGIAANQAESIELAARHGFESVEAKPQELATMDDAQLQNVLRRMNAHGLAWGASGLPLDFRNDEERFRDDLKKLPALMKGLQRAGVDRVGTWISPCDDTLTYLQNFKRHTRRLSEVAIVLKDHGQRFGLEYVGTFNSRTRRRHPFIHTMAETGELIASIWTGNIGYILDSWHWWCADETDKDILRLRNDQVVAADLNDAPLGLDKREQKDNRRELPAATGVIDIASFLKALQTIGFDGPVRAEPFNEALRELDQEKACAATAKALRKAFAFVDQSAATR